MMRSVFISVVALTFVGVQIVLLWYMGQPLTYVGGYVELWHGAVLSDGNSQHLTDWYTLSHIIHGFVFYVLLALLFPRMPVGYRLLLAIAVEIGWELFENSDFIINRYREQALAQGYFGDSVVNSIGDTLAAVFGFMLAWRLPIVVSVGLVIALEIIALIAIRDSLVLNVMQLLHPSDVIGAWQARM